MGTVTVCLAVLTTRIELLQVSDTRDALRWGLGGGTRGGSVQWRGGGEEEMQRTWMVVLAASSCDPAREDAARRRPTTHQKPMKAERSSFIAWVVLASGLGR
jgi:hypothetical protein